MNFYSLNFLFIIIIVILILSLCIFIPSLSEYGYISAYIQNTNSNIVYINSSNFIWPTPGYTTITSNFGARKSPTTGKSSFHYGMDIGAPQGTNIIAISSRHCYFYRL